MLYRPSTLEEPAQQAFEDHAEDCRQRMLDHVEAMLRELPPEAAQPVYDLAFSTSEALPKRQRRPKVDTVVLVEALASARDLADLDREALLRLTIVVQEYFDIVDDIFDGDVAEGREGEALLVSQLLVPMMTRQLARLGTDAGAYWSDRAQEVMCAPLLETDAEPSPETYLQVLDRQAPLYGLCAGLAAVTDGADDVTIDRFESLGEAMYVHRQLVLDGEQYHCGDPDPWNGRSLLGESGLERELDALERRVDALSEGLPAEQADRIRALSALDTTAWRARLREEK